MEVHQSGRYEIILVRDLDWDFEEVLKVGVQTKFPPKLPQPGGERSTER